MCIVDSRGDRRVGSARGARHPHRPVGSPRAAGDRDRVLVNTTALLASSALVERFYGSCRIAESRFPFRDPSAAHSGSGLARNESNSKTEEGLDELTGITILIGAH